jgi:hypothetical protein
LGGGCQVRCAQAGFKNLRGSHFIKARPLHSRCQKW